ncbi:MAG: hypothetical protein HGA87_01990 [Desulfobulbaceae bacterium]|nr:hypothetical protein [Desulfobulbaceae bacterium]
MKIGRNDPCPCGSGKKYKKCCLVGRHHSVDFMEKFRDLSTLSKDELKRKYGDIFKPDTETKQIFAKFHKLAYHELNIPCFHPNQQECSSKTIKAHSISKSLLKRLMDSTNHVAMFGASFKPDIPPLAGIRCIGINDATVFTGLCSKHDNATFKLIDTSDPVAFDVECQFLMCYRALLKELFAKTRQFEISKRQVELINTETNPESPVVPFAVLYSYGCYVATHFLGLMKKNFEAVLQSRDFLGCLEYGVRKISVSVPISVCTLFSPVKDSGGNVINDLRDYKEMPKYFFLTIIPSATETYVFYATLKHQTSMLASYVNPLQSLDGPEVFDYLSEMILKYAENFVMSPLHWDKFRQEKKAEIERLFNQTIFDKEFVYDSEKHNIFVP